jgi:hypothetical protein
MMTWRTVSRNSTHLNELDKTLDFRRARSSSTVKPQTPYCYNFSSCLKKRQIFVICYPKNLYTLKLLIIIIFLSLSLIFFSHSFFLYFFEYFLCILFFLLCTCSFSLSLFLSLTLVFYVFSLNSISNVKNKNEKLEEKIVFLEKTSENISLCVCAERKVCLENECNSTVLASIKYLLNLPLVCLSDATTAQAKIC